MTELKDRFVYILKARNLRLGVYVEEVRGFVGIREKFDHRYLATEYLRSAGDPHGTAMPVGDPVAELPEGYSTRETVALLDTVTGRPVRLDPSGSGHVYTDTGEPMPHVNRCSLVSNSPLFRFLSDLEMEIHEGSGE